MKNKKVLISIVAVVAIIGLGVLGLRTKASNSTIEFYSDKAGAESAIEIAGATAGDVIGMSVDFIPYADEASYKTAVQQTITTSDAPDIMSWWTGAKLEDLVAQDLLVDLSDQWDAWVEAGVDPALKDAVSVNGKVYAAPLNVLYSGVFYNVDVFNQYGLEVPTTYEEFVAVCDELVANGVTPLAVKNDPWAITTWVQLVINATEPEAYQELMAGEIGYDDPRIVAATEEFASWVEKGYFAEPTNYDAHLQRFVNGEVAMIYEPTTELLGLEENYGMVPVEDVAAFPFPAEEGAETTTIFIEVAPLVIPKNSDKVEESKAFLQEFMKPENQQVMVDEANMVATTNTIVDNEAYQNFADEVQNDSYTLEVRYHDSAPIKVDQIAGEEWWKIFYNPTKEQVAESTATIEAARQESLAE